MLNKVQFIGYLGRDPETRYLSSGDAVTNFSVASTEKWKDKATGEQKEATEWLRCSAFGRLAEVCGEYLQKGSLVYVEGKLQTRKYTDSNGVEKYSTECRLDGMKMLGGRSEQSDAPPRQQAKQESRKPAPAGNFDDFDDDIPF